MLTVEFDEGKLLPQLPAMRLCFFHSIFVTACLQNVLHLVSILAVEFEIDS